MKSNVRILKIKIKKTKKNYKMMQKNQRNILL